MAVEWGTCEYCKRYRPLKYGYITNKYCSEDCYAKSGEKAQDEWYAAEVQAEDKAAWGDGDSLMFFVFRCAFFIVGWLLFLWIISEVMDKGIKNAGCGFVGIAEVLHDFNRLGLLPQAAVCLGISIVQNLLVRFLHLYGLFRKAVFYGIPIAIFVLTILFYAPVSPLAVDAKAQREKYEAKLEKKAAKRMEKWYTPEADVIVGQEYVSLYTVDASSGKITPHTVTVFGKNGLAFESDKYTVDTATRTITVGTRKKDKTVYHYFPDGSAYYQSFFSAAMGFPKVGAKFNAEMATEVIGKSFSGKWSDKYTATITFGKDGRATVKFSDGDTASGAYIASDEDNMVLYNHKDAGVWATLSYNDDYSKVKFCPYRAVKENGKYDKFPHRFDYTAWKLQ